MQTVTLLLAGAASLSAPALAQETMPPPPPQTVPDVPPMPPPELTADQMAEQAEWSDDQRQAYDGWSGMHQAYFWTLPPNRQEYYWNLTPGARMELESMTTVQREDAWSGLEARMAGIDSAPPPEAPPSAPDAKGDDMPASPKPDKGASSGDEIMDDDHGSVAEPR